MANIKSSKKDIKRSEKRRVVNQGVRTSLKTYIKKAKSIATEDDKEKVTAAVSCAIKAIDKAAQRGIIHKNQANRRKSRMMQQVNKLSAGK